METAISHVRLHPKRHALNNSIFNIVMDIDMPQAIENRWLKHNKFGFFSIYDQDYGQKEQPHTLKQWFNAACDGANITQNFEKVYLVTMPRVLGFGFNPVSFWLAFKAQKLVAVMAEVNNTFGERHCYFLENEGLELTPSSNLVAKKMFHVSPFMTLEGDYHFRFSVSSSKILIKLDLVRGGERHLITTMLGHLKPITEGVLSKQILKPHQTLKVLFFIHFNALKLFYKRIKFIPKPNLPDNYITKS